MEGAEGMKFKAVVEGVGVSLAPGEPGLERPLIFFAETREAAFRAGVAALAGLTKEQKKTAVAVIYEQQEVEVIRLYPREREP